MALIPTPEGYLAAHLSVDGKQKRFMAHRLVCEAFNGPQPPDGPFCAHWNDIPTDNRASNLRWASPLENSADARRNGRLKSGTAKLTVEQVAAIRCDKRIARLIAPEFDCSESTVWMIKRGVIWKRV